MRGTGVISSSHHITIETRFFSKVLAPNVDGCWLWIGSKTKGGYGNFADGGKTVYAHRWSWGLFMGEIPKGLTVDHLCQVKLCVNPWHMDLVTREINLSRKSAAQTHCSNGHLLSGENLRGGAAGRRSRTCRVCHNVSQRVYHQKRKGKQ